MAYDREFLKVSWTFADQSSQEIGITSLNYSVIPGWSGALAALGEIDLEVSAGENLLDAMNDLVGNVNLRHAIYSALISVKVAAIGTNGLYLGSPKEHEIDTVIPGTVVQTLPQATVVCSLFSGSTIGSANHGRMYLPHTALPLETSSSSSLPADTDSVVASFATFVNAVTGILTGQVTDDVEPFIMSNQSPKPSKPVTVVKVGTVTDTQRRRRNQLTEFYSSATL